MEVKNEIIFNPSDRIKVIAGKYIGRVGIFTKNCSVVFPDWCKVTFDLTKRERIQKTVMILKSEIEHE